jgi:hypothetical protein
VPSENIATYEGGNSDLRAPYLGYSTNSVLYQTIGTSNYNALQFSVRKRLSGRQRLQQQDGQHLRSDYRIHARRHRAAVDAAGDDWF